MNSHNTFILQKDWLNSHKETRHQIYSLGSSEYALFTHRPRRPFLFHLLPVLLLVNGYIKINLPPPPLPSRFPLYPFFISKPTSGAYRETQKGGASAVGEWRILRKIYSLCEILNKMSQKEGWGQGLSPLLSTPMGPDSPDLPRFCSTLR